MAFKGVRLQLKEVPVTKLAVAALLIRDRLVLITLGMGAHQTQATPCLCAILGNKSQ